MKEISEIIIRLSVFAALLLAIIAADCDNAKSSAYKGGKAVRETSICGFKGITGTGDDSGCK